MRIRTHADALEFLAAADPFLNADPFSTSVIATVAKRTADDPPPDNDRLWITIAGEAGELLGVAMHTPPFPLFVSRMPAAAAAALAQTLLDAERELPGVNGICDATAAFADVWTGHTGQIATVVYSMRMYRLASLQPPTGVSGHAAPAGASDIKLLTEWFGLFQEEALPHSPAGDDRAIVESRIAAGELHLWHDGGRVVSVAGVTAPAAGVARIGPVYTPADARRQGYGAAVTAAASAAALAAGAEQIVLYADLANPVSNSIYQAIGYRPDHDGESRLFSREPVAA